ncbi:SDR family oxidoreductase [Mycobacterium sp. CVI_P3]|uniref:SDR family oxidoreductase n=1 Tax=Mycobacterium pinniadriaticum TaxID=2994102 RepID=A0ABT3SEX4_9MYCO|nr:SDR family oxidoreductase [Mycobacterium pinniadriaticum]MCX2931542.1 SDR family oxidoreductase [Mycobacterium pinniadriaticum]MCX2938066.1 SDR family oxidoreductase [Mycobacterium pinniadriaticum]
MSGPGVFITGAAAGIGRATALNFARQGYRVGAYDVDLDGLGVLRDEISERGGDVTIGALDVTDAAAWSARLREFTGAAGKLDILVNNAGVLTAGAFSDVPLPVHRQMIDINFYGALAGLHAAFPYLRDTAHAQVVNMCSASALYGQPELATYSATKFALRALTEALELEWRRYDIRVLAMWPLFVKTAMTDGVETGSTKSLGVNLSPEDVAAAVYAATHRRRRLTKVHYPVGRQTSVLAAMSQVSPNWMQRLITKVLTRT